MAEIKITDLVSQETIDKIKELNGEMQSLLTSYSNTAKELAKGLDVRVKVVGDIDQLEKLLIDKTKEATATTEKLNEVMAQRSKVVADTTNTISRQLMEQERVNKVQRETYTEHERVKKLLESYHDTYKGQLESLNSLTNQLKANKEAQKSNEAAYAAGKITLSEYSARQVELLARNRELTQQKRTLSQIMAAEEKAAQAQDGSYVQMSQHLELLKKAYKELSEEGRNSPFGREIEASIQNLDAHLKDVAADMGEFQRNVGNYAIAGRNGVVSTESLMEALKQEAITIKDVSDQSKILTEARGMLNTSDANYDKTVSMINSKLAENRRKLADVSDIMNVQATTAAEAEAQNKRLVEAIKQVDQTSEGADRMIRQLNAKIDENNKIIEAGNGSRASIKKDLKELVIEIANLSIEYQSLTAEEKASAEGQALAEHIRELTNQAGALKDAISDTNTAISNAASDTRTLDQLSGSIQLAIDGFGLATGAAEMLGISEGELAEIQTKLQAAIAASNAMTKIQNALQKQSAVVQGVNVLQTKLRTTAETIHTAAQGKGIIVTKAATAAQWAFNAAANANPIGLLVVAIVACIAAVYGLIKAFEAFVGPSRSATKELEKQSEEVDRLKKHHEEMIGVLEASGASAERIARYRLKSLDDEIAKQREAIRVAREKGASQEEIAKAVEKEHELVDELGNLYEAQYFGLQKIISDVNLQELKEKEGNAAVKKKLLDEEIDGQKRLIEQLRETAILYDKETSKLDEALVALEKKREQRTKEINKEAANQAQSLMNELKAAVRKGEDDMLKLIEDSYEREKAVEETAYRRKIDDLDNEIKAKRHSAKMVEALNTQKEAAEIEHRRKLEAIEEASAERRNKIEADLIASHLATVKEGSDEEYDWKLKSLQNQYDAELLAIDKSERTKSITTEQAETLRTDLVMKYAMLREKAEEDHASKMADLVQKRYANEQDDRNNAYIQELNDLKTRYARELAEAAGNAEKQAEIEKKFEDEQARLSESYAKKTAESTIRMLEETLLTEELSAEDRLKYERELAKAKIELEGLMADAALSQIKKTLEADNEAKEKRLKNWQDWAHVASEVLSNINELAGAVYDGQIQKIEDQQEANDAAAEAEIERITKLVEQSVITEEEGEARKRAAEDRTAQKTEELEKKKAQIKYKQAIFDKALSVANIGLNTAMALMQLWVKPGWPAAIPMMAVVGALGAMQLATVLATPIPKYAKGTDRHRGGPAIVGDGGVKEVVLYGDQAWLTPDRPTLVDLPAGASVYPNVIDFTQNAPAVSPQSLPPTVIVNNDNKNLEEKMDKVIYLFTIYNRNRRTDGVVTDVELLKNWRQ